MIFSTLAVNSIHPEVTQLLLRKEAEEPMLPALSRRRLGPGMTSDTEGEGFTFRDPAPAGEPMLPAVSQRRLGPGQTGAPGEGPGFTFQDPPPPSTPSAEPPSPGPEAGPAKEPKRRFNLEDNLDKPVGKTDYATYARAAVRNGKGLAKQTWGNPKARLAALTVAGVLGNAEALHAIHGDLEHSVPANAPAPSEAEMEAYRQAHSGRKLPAGSLTGGDALALGGGALAGGGLGYALSNRLKTDPVASALVGAGAGGGLGYLIKRIATNKRP